MYYLSHRKIDNFSGFTEFVYNQAVYFIRIQRVGEIVRSFIKSSYSVFFRKYYFGIKFVYILTITTEFIFTEIFVLDKRCDFKYTVERYLCIIHCMKGGFKSWIPTVFLYAKDILQLFEFTYFKSEKGNSREIWRRKVKDLKAHKEVVYKDSLSAEDGY